MRIVVLYMHMRKAQSRSPHTAHARSIILATKHAKFLATLVDIWNAYSAPLTLKYYTYTKQSIHCKDEAWSDLLIMHAVCSIVSLLHSQTSCTYRALLALPTINIYTTVGLAMLCPLHQIAPNAALPISLEIIFSRNYRIYIQVVDQHGPGCYSMRYGIPAIGGEWVYWGGAENMCWLVESQQN